MGSSRVTFDCADVGKRVSVRVRLPDGMFSDMVGVLEACDAAGFTIRDRNGRPRYANRAYAVAGRIVSPEKAPRTRG